MLTVCSRRISGTLTQDEAGDLPGGLLVQPGKDMAVGVLQRLYFLAAPWRCAALPEPEQPPRQPAKPPPSSDIRARRRPRR
jgi:hypothetical protein